jgi:tetrapyrrole methylase family protein/MazG family protein
MNQYPDDHQVILVHAAGTEYCKLEALPLHELDHSRQVAHMTSLYVPALPQTSAFESFQDTISRLRAPDGCPWDREQTHQSLRPGLMEETAEVLDALDAEDMDALCEELGDLLLHIVMQMQIAAEDGDFTSADVIAGIDAKIRRRHPHVFAESRVSSPDEVLVHWHLIKEAERSTEEPISVMDEVPVALPALARASALLGKAAKAGAVHLGLDDVVTLVRRGIDAVLETQDADERATRLGDLLLMLANWARWLEVDPETELRSASQRFAERFRILEQRAARRETSVGRLSPSENRTLWHTGQPGSD